VTLRLVVCCLAALAVAAPSATAATADPQLHRYDLYGVYTREQRSWLVSAGYDIGEAAWPDHVELYATAAEAGALALNAGLRPVPDPEVREFDFPPQDSNYHNYAEMVAEVRGIAAAHPDTVHLFSLGTSYEGRDLIGARVSNDANDNLSEPGVLFVGQHHAREHLSVEVVLGLLHYFADSPKPAVRRAVRTRQIYIVPSLDPDGSEYDIATGAYRYWRKNRQPTPQPDVYGTDENRNYSYNWGCCEGSSSDPTTETYRGAFPLSAPEDARLAAFVIARPNITTGISYHSFASLILYPYGYTYLDVPADMLPVDHQAFVAIAARLETLTGYHAQQSSDLYITDGDWNDWMYGSEHRYPFTIELGPKSFYPPDEYIAFETERNLHAALYLTKVAGCPTNVVGVRCHTSR
jgi:carboxypeptidase T